MSAPGQATCAAAAAPRRCTPTSVRCGSAFRGTGRHVRPGGRPEALQRLAGFDDAVLSLYAKGLTTADIANHLADIYGTQVARDLVSRVTDAVLEQMAQWQNRPLDPVYRCC